MGIGMLNTDSIVCKKHIINVMVKNCRSKTQKLNDANQIRDDNLSFDVLSNPEFLS